MKRKRYSVLVALPRLGSSAVDTTPTHFAWVLAESAAVAMERAIEKAMKDYESYLERGEERPDEYQYEVLLVIAGWHRGL